MDAVITKPAALKRFKTIEFTVGAQFAALVANDDATGITRQEMLQFRAFEFEARAGAPDGFVFTHWGIDAERRDEFAKCEVTGLVGECLGFSAVYFLKG